MPVKEARIGGIGLHSGRPAEVILRARPGPFALSAGGEEVPLSRLVVVSAQRSTSVAVGASRVATVEHVLAACAGLAIHEGLVLEVIGEEVPLLDGGAQRWCEALAGLSLAPSAPPLVVRDDGVVDLGASRYTFAVGSQRLEVLVDYGDSRLASAASWAGDAAGFAARIAPARTFAFVHELGDLAANGLAQHAAPESVIVLGPDGILSAGRPFEPDEPARHKLLDLMGDLFLYGGPPEGLVSAVRPGHAKTHEAIRQALQRGLVGYR